MAIFDVGRPAVREALLSLEKTGIIPVRSGLRAFVTRPTTAGLISQLTNSAKHLSDVEKLYWTTITGAPKPAERAR
jgi:DNA-binding FadR family transcriptional regulator